MKKITKKIISYFLVFCLILTPLLFTGCIELFLETDGGEEPTFYVGAVRNTERVYAEANALEAYRVKWEDYASQIINGLIDEYGNSSKFGDRNKTTSENGIVYAEIKNRTDYLPDYKGLFNALYSMDLSSKQEIAQNLANFTHCSLHTDGYGCYTLVLTDDQTTNNEWSVLAPSGDPENGSGALKLNTKYVVCEKESEASSTYVYKTAIGSLLDTGRIVSYTDDLSEKLGKGDEMFRQGQSGYKVFYLQVGNPNNPLAQGRRALIIIGNYNQSQQLGDGSNLAGRAKSFIKKLYKTNYDKMNHYVFFNETSAVYFKENVEYLSEFRTSGWFGNYYGKYFGDFENNELIRYVLAAEIIKNVFFDSKSSRDSVIYRCYPTGILSTSYRLGTGAFESLTFANEEMDEEEGVLVGNITAISLGNLYDKMHDPKSRTISAGSNGKYDTIVVNGQDIEEGDSEAVTTAKQAVWIKNYATLFVDFSYQFLNGIYGFEDSKIDEVADAVLGTCIGVKAISNEGAPTGKSYKDFLSSELKVITQTNNRVAEKTLWPILAPVCVDRTILVSDVRTQEVVEMSYLKFEDISDESNKTEFGFFSPKKYKYHSFAFEAWGGDYMIDYFAVKIRFLTEEEESAGVQSDAWKIFAEHYSFTVQQYRNGVFSEWEFDSKVFEDSGVESGLLLFDFANAKNTSGKTPGSLMFSDQQKMKKSPFEPSIDKKIYEFSNNGSAFAYKGRVDKTPGLEEEFVQIIFGVDSEVNRVEFSIETIFA